MLLRSYIYLAGLHANYGAVQALMWGLGGGVQVGVQLLLLFMLIFFTGLALRESVLKV